jgi:hypothetical protein
MTTLRICSGKLGIFDDKLLVCGTTLACVLNATPSVVIGAWSGSRTTGCACSVFQGTFTLAASTCGGSFCGFTRFPGPCSFAWSVATGFCSPAPPGVGICLSYGPTGYTVEVGCIDIATLSGGSVGYWAVRGTDLADLCSPLVVPRQTCLTSDCTPPSSVTVHLV